jgi:hypothetical protein
MLKPISINWKIIIGILGSIILGAIGSGLWSILGEPFTAIIGKIMFNIATLGLESLRNNIYKSAAMGFHEESSLFSLILLIMLFVFGQGIFCYFYFNKIFEGKSIKKLQTQLKDMNNEQQNAFFQDRKERLLRLAKINFIPLFLATIFCAVFMFLRLYLLICSNETVTYFHQSIEICNPYLSTESEKSLRSHFASMKIKDDFLKIQSELIDISKKANFQLPKFNPN